MLFIRYDYNTMEKLDKEYCKNNDFIEIAKEFINLFYQI